MTLTYAHLLGQLWELTGKCPIRLYVKKFHVKQTLSLDILYITFKSGNIRGESTQMVFTTAVQMSFLHAGKNYSSEHVRIAFNKNEIHT